MKKPRTQRLCAICHQRTKQVLSHRRYRALCYEHVLAGTTPKGIQKIEQWRYLLHRELQLLICPNCTKRWVQQGDRSRLPSREELALLHEAESIPDLIVKSW